MSRFKIAILAGLLLTTCGPSAPAVAAASTTDRTEMQIKLCEVALSIPAENPGKLLDDWMVENGWTLEDRVQTMTLCFAFARGMEFESERH